MSSVAAVVLDFVVAVERVVGPAVGPDQLQLSVELVVSRGATVGLLAEPDGYMASII